MFERFINKKREVPAKEEFEELESSIRRKEDILSEKHRGNAKGTLLSRLSRHITVAKIKLEEMKNAGREEASDLNREYDRLRAESQRALEALHDFEVNKLGMADDNGDQ